MAPLNQNPNNPVGGNLEGPASSPPPGRVSNFDNPQNLNTLVHAVLVVVLIITSIVVILRVYSRIVLRMVDIPTILGLIAFGLQLGFISLYFKLLNTYGWFVHMWDLRLEDFIGLNHIFFQGSVLYLAIALILKPAILLDWISIFCPAKTRNLFFWSSCAVLTAHVLSYISFLIVELAECHPFEKNWNPLIPGKCLNTVHLAIGVSSTNLTFDLIIFLLPQQVIWGLRMRTRTKIGVSIVFAVGLLACVAASFRLYSALQYVGAKDVTYTFCSLALWSLAELTSGFIVLCGPCIPKTVARMELNRLGPSLKSWAGASVRKITGSRASDGDSVSGLTHKQSEPSMSQSKGSHEQSHSSSAPTLPPKTAARGFGIPVSEGEDEWVNNTSILRTTHFTAVEGHQPEDTTQDRHMLQHPWISS
ncbi:hypothetical protein F5Y10DRAFT_247856 [Nemania abortiva]|nr:hypothetical protein F5Y10DRAFT_247856 [Nemania abortiva]